MDRPGGLSYFPMQKVAKIRFRMSSAVVAPVIASIGLSDAGYREYLAGEGAAAYERAQEEAVTDQVFGVPLFYFEKEPFWGYDRMGLLEQRLTEAGLKREEPLRLVETDLQSKHRLAPREDQRSAHSITARTAAPGDYTSRGRTSALGNPA